LSKQSRWCKTLCSKSTKIRLAAGLRPDPMGELKRSPDTLATIGAISKEREGRGLILTGREGRGGRRRKGKGKGREKIYPGPPTFKKLPPPILAIL